MCISEMTRCLDILSTGADAQVKRAFEVVAKAMQLQATGNAWEAILHGEQEAHDKYDKSQADLISVKTDPSFLSQEGNLMALKGKKAALEAALQRSRALHKENHEGRKTAFAEADAQFKSNKDDAKALALIQQKAWNEDHRRRV